ncbi:MAG: hypothetical protein A2Y12_05405 [Planctomycetes bacterium GWF2_42_9]|nr:MAG: hypothetical protein A2Y12_05405 [Planctomycetes bacterium GWF2_42_9]
MANFDWIIVISYILCLVGIGMYFTKQAAKSTTSFFLAGRTLPWFISGTSMIATDFSAAAPLMISGISRESGISGNWFWWCFAIGGITTAFFFARLWRRTEVLTDIEFIAKRYEPSKAASFLRLFKVLFDGVLINCVVMASGTVAIAKIIKVVLNLSDTAIFHLPLLGDVTSTGVLLSILGGSAVLYSSLSGLYGAAYTNLLQFVMAMIGSIVLAAIVYIDASHGVGLMAKLTTSSAFKPSLLQFFPDLNTFSLPTFTFFVYIFLAWWAFAPGSGQYAQRILAARSEKDFYFGISVV